MYYSLNDYQLILQEKIIGILPESTKIIIDKIIKQLGVSTPTFISKPANNYEQRRGKVNHRRANNNSSSNTDWETLRSFKPTVIVEKEGIEKIMSDIRMNLNKISAKNYDTNRDFILTHLESITTQEEVCSVANAIFEIASTNKFFSEIYSKLYKELTNKYEIFTTILQDFLKGFIERLKNLQYVDPNGNYDEYCKYNKLNDANKSISVFITNLVKNEVVSSETLYELILEIQEYIFDRVNVPEKINEIEEMTENLFLLFTNSISFMTNDENSKKIIENIRIMSQWKVKEFPSISSRAIFKYKDMVDKLAKK